MLFCMPTDRTGVAVVMGAPTGAVVASGAKHIIRRRID